MDMNYVLTEYETDTPSNEYFKLHVHDDYEIFLFLEGDSKYVIEENTYPLAPGDVIIIRKNQLHRIYHNNCVKYSRIVLNVAPEFFVENNCSEYEEKFINPNSDIGNKIDAKTVKKSGLYDAIFRLKKDSDDFRQQNSPIVRSVLVEILYIINNVKLYKESVTESKQIQEVIKYLNDNFTEKITLDELERRFFISKYHICHIFPDITGLTVHQYITKKRLVLARDLIKSGKSKSVAAEMAGFSNYSSFYRAYVNDFN